MCHFVAPILQVDSLLLVPDRPPGRPLAAAVAGDSVYLLDPREAVEPHVLHSVYGHPVTCLAASSSQLALGVKSSGWAMHDGGNKVGLRFWGNNILKG